MTVVVPANARGPVPLLMMFGPSRLPAPAQPPQDDVDSLNAALKRLLVQNDPSLQAIFDRYPAYELVTRASPFGFGGFGAPGAQNAEPPTTTQLLRDGWGYAYIDPSSIQADNGAGLTQGIIGLVNHGQPRKPDDWGSLRAWAWGAARGPRLSRDGFRGGREARRHRGRVALRQGRARDPRLRAAVRAGADRVLGEGGRDAAAPQLRRGGREPHRHGRVPLDGGQLPEVRRRRWDVRRRERGPAARWTRTS